MKSKFVVATVVALAGLTSVGAFAQTSQNRLEGEAANAVRFAPSTSNLTRAQVNAEFLQARANGELPLSAEGGFAPADQTASNLTRKEVRDEAAHYVIMDGSNRRIYR